MQNRSRPPARWPRRLAWGVAIALATVLGIAAAYPRVWLAGPALRDESQRVPELAAPVTIRRDAFGVAHVTASEPADVWAGLGFAQAQDRACQVEMLVRVAEGSLSEWIGDVPLGGDLRAAGLDRLARELGLAERAERSWDGADPETRERLTRFAAGANARLASLGRRKPACFRLLASPPRRWRERDPLLLLELYGLVGQIPSLRAQALATELTAALGEARTAELLPPEVMAQRAPVAASSRSPLAALPIEADVLSGSNAWAVGATRSLSGGALLAADPHVIADRSPTWWYLAHVSAGSLDAQGLFLPGTPLLAVGHTRRLAWGVTSTLLRTGGVEAAPPDKVVTPVAAPPIVPRFGAQRAVTVRRAGEVVVIDDPTKADGSAARLALTLGASDGARQLRGFAALLTLADARALDLASADLRAGPLSWRLVLADAAGHVASRTAAPLPPGDRVDPYRMDDPASGRVVSANTAPDPGAPAAWPGAFEATDRADRITELLDATPRHSPESFRRIQLDVTSLLARRAVPAIVADLGGDPALEAPRAALAAWDGRCDRESAGCAAFELLVEALPRLAFADELGAERFGHFASVGDLALRAATRLLAEPASPWWDDVTTEARESRAEIVRRAARAALEQLTAEGGDEPEGWNWGAFHTLRLANPLAAIPVLGRHFERGPFAHPGDRYTVNAAGFSRATDGPERVVKLGPSSRFVIDLATPERGYFACSTGMSEDPFSGYAWNLTDSWLAGELFAESLDGPLQVLATATLAPPT